MFIDTDASNTGVGAMLIRRDEKGYPHPVAYASRKMTTAEKFYSTREQETLAILFGIEKFDQYVRGRRSKVANPSPGYSRYRS